MYKAFIDRMPIFEEAQNLYPEALPTATFHGNTLLEPRTMFIIMKRFFFLTLAIFPTNSIITHDKAFFLQISYDITRIYID